MASRASTSSGPVGRTEPRLSTPPARRLTRRTTLGFEAAEFAEGMLGMTLLPWQKYWLEHALELEPGGGFRFRTVVTLVGRQNGKTALLTALSLWMLYMGRARLVLGAAQSLDISRESWQNAVGLAQGDPDLAAEVDFVRRTNGEQELRLTSGARYRIAAATRSAGRGLSVDLLVLDEIRQQRNWDSWAALSKTTMARPNGLTVAISNAGDDESVVLNHLREAALSGADPSIGLFEWSAPDGCDLDDPNAWAQGNPGLGRIITAGAIRSALGTDPPNTFRTEVLCQRVEALDAAVPVDGWRACADPAMTLDGLRDRVHLCLDISPDLAHATLAAAALGADGRPRVEVVAAWSGARCTEQARLALPGWREKVRPRSVGWYPGGPASALAADLRKLPRSVELKAGDVPSICQGLAELAGSRRLLHPNDPLLTAHVAGAQRLYSGDGWRFTRRGAGHCDAAYAAAGAVHLARTVVSVGKPRIILASTA